MSIGLFGGSGSTGQVGTWLAILIAGSVALAFVLGMFWLFDVALDAIETTRPSSTLQF